MSFVVYALLQPKKLIIPAMWETTFASIHAYKIYEILNGDRIVLTSDELKLYALLFRHDELDPVAFRRLVDLGQWATHNKGKVLTTQGEDVEKVSVLFKGSVCVEIGGKRIFTIDKQGGFVGEQALGRLITTDNEDAGKSTATRTCESEEMVCFEWPMDKLKQFAELDPAGGALIKTFFRGVLQKVDSQRGL